PHSGRAAAPRPRARRRLRASRAGVAPCFGRGGPRVAAEQGLRCLLADLQGTPNGDGGPLFNSGSLGLEDEDLEAAGRVECHLAVVRLHLPADYAFHRTREAARHLLLEGQPDLTHERLLAVLGQRALDRLP